MEAPAQPETFCQRVIASASIRPSNADRATASSLFQLPKLCRSGQLVPRPDCRTLALAKHPQGVPHGLVASFNLRV